MGLCGLHLPLDAAVRGEHRCVRVSDDVLAPPQKSPLALVAFTSDPEPHRQLSSQAEQTAFFDMVRRLPGYQADGRDRGRTRISASRAADMVSFIRDLGPRWPECRPRMIA